MEDTVNLFGGWWVGFWELSDHWGKTEQSKYLADEICLLFCSTSEAQGTFSDLNHNPLIEPEHLLPQFTLQFGY